MSSLIDVRLPSPDRREVHSIRVARSPAETMAAAREVPASEIPVAVFLMAIRSLPALLARKRPPAPRGPVLHNFQKMGFVVLDDTPRELVVGGIGRFWKPSGDIRRVEPEEFGGFAEPGYAKTAFNFRVEPDPPCGRQATPGTLLTTETRIDGTDEAARRNFRRYWRLIYPGSALIRVAWLRAIRRRAERGYAASS
jgi:hypothetical protein